MSRQRSSITKLGRAVVHALGRSGSPYVLPWEATVREDLALRRPVLVVARLLRLIVRFRASRWTPAPLRLRPGATVVIINWNGVELLPAVLSAVRRYSPPDTEILVVDNASSDGSRELLRTMASRGQIRTVLLPRNLYHGPAMDLGFLLARTDFVVALDVDAFPIRDTWLDDLTRPLTEGAAVVGAQAARGYVHPCCLAMRVADFARRRHTFSPHDMGTVERPLTEDNWSGIDVAGYRWDTGESISGREGRLHCTFLPRTSVRGPAQLGSTFGDAVFHNGASTRIPAGERVEGITIDDVRSSWQEAVATHLPAPVRVWPARDCLNSDAPDAPPYPVDLSVIIAARDAAETLGDQLAALLDQDAGGASWEIVVVDNHSTDDTAAIAAHHADRGVALRVVPAFDRLGAGYARNVGTSVAFGDAFAFCDADDVVGDNWVASMASALRHHDFVTGPNNVARLNPTWLAGSRGLAHTRELTSFEGMFPYASACNLGVTRTAFEAVGGFDPDYQIVEDLDLSRRLWDAGSSLVFLPELEVHYRYPIDAGRGFRQARGYGRGRVHICEDIRRSGSGSPSRTAGIKNWIWLLRNVGILRSHAGRARWRWVLGNRIGSLEGSIVVRRLYL